MNPDPTVEAYRGCQRPVPHFDGICSLVPLPDGTRWEVDHPLCYHGRDGLRIRVPRGFVTDLASVPRIFWPIYAPFGQYTQAAVVHDFLYSDSTRSRPLCDSIFWEAMGVCGVSGRDRAILYGMVRLFGWLRFYLRRRDRR